MVQGIPLEADTWAYNQEIACSVQNVLVYFRTHKSSPLVPILSQVNLIYIFISSRLVYWCSGNVLELYKTDICYHTQFFRGFPESFQIPAEARLGQITL
jgi:hypothetical protein